MRENEPVLLVLSVCDGEIILEKGEILCEKCQLCRTYVENSDEASDNEAEVEVKGKYDGNPTGR